VPHKNKSHHASVELLDIRIQDLPTDCLVTAIITAAQGATPRLFNYANVHALNLSVCDPRFKRILQEADTVYCDGVGVRLGAWLSGQKLQHRNTPPDWLPLLAAACIEHDISLYLLGAKLGVAEQACANLTALAPGVRIVGVHHGYFDKQAGSKENAAVIRTINESGADILIVGFGMPGQEYWIEENRSQLNAKVFLPVGAMLDYLAGSVYRAPQWITDNGFEWLARLFVEPRRLWRRYVVGNPLFLWRVFIRRVSAWMKNYG